MKIALKILSYIGLVLTVGPSFLVFNQIIDLQNHKWIALVGTILWISTAPFWINEKKMSN